MSTKNDVTKVPPIGEDTRPKDWVKLGLSPSTVVVDMDSTKVLRSKMVQALCDYKSAYDNSEALTPEEDPELQRLYYAYSDLYNEYMDRLVRSEEYV